jgi:hypothetical protein
MILYSRWASRHSVRSSSPCRPTSSFDASVDRRTSDSRNIARIRSGACTLTAPNEFRACAAALRRSVADASSTVPPSRSTRRAS